MLAVKSRAVKHILPYLEGCGSFCIPRFSVGVQIEFAFSEDRVNVIACDCEPVAGVLTEALRNPALVADKSAIISPAWQRRISLFFTKRPSSIEKSSLRWLLFSMF